MIIEPLANTDAFVQYDDTLMVALTDAVHKELNRGIDPNDFAQLPAGHVIIQMVLNASGQAGDFKIVENTVSDAVGQFFLRALEHASPYKAWPADAHAAPGADTRTLKVTFYYD